jgi:hypothetical protein
MKEEGRRCVVGILAGIKGSIVSIGSLWAQQVIGATLSSAFSMVN